MTNPVYRPALDIIRAGGSLWSAECPATNRRVTGPHRGGRGPPAAGGAPPPPAASTPTAAATALGLVVAWDGTLTATTPADFHHVEVHLSTSSGFTPGAGTLKGTLRNAGIFPIAGLAAGTTYYTKLVGVNTSAVAGPA